jgi:tetratricopeptide (TPR) repeat protein
LDEAVRHLQISREIDPDFPLVYYQLGEVAAQRGQWRQAQKWFARMLNVESRMWFGHQALGRAFAADGKLDQAEKHLSESIRLEPNDPESHYQLGRVYSARGQASEALKSFHRAVDLNPGSARYRFALGIVLRRRGDVEGANREYKAAVERDANWRLAAAQSAWALATDPNPLLRDGALAVHLAELACDSTTDRPPLFLDVQAAAYAEDGQFDRAVAVARDAVKSAETAGDERLAKEIAQRIGAYQSRRPFRDSRGWKH